MWKKPQVFGVAVDLKAILRDMAKEKLDEARSDPHGRWLRHGRNAAAVSFRNPTDQQGLKVDQLPGSAS